MDFMLKLINVGWIVDLLKKLCLFFDWLIYSVAAWVFNIFYKIAKIDMNLNIEGVDANVDLSTIVDRFKLFIGIIVLFMLVKTLITYLSNPDGAVAPTKKIIINVLVSISLLIMSPTIFDVLSEFQQAIINEGTIPKLLLGPEAGEGFQENAGKTFMNNIFTLFFRCDNCGFTDEFENVRNGNESILSLINLTNKTGVVYEYPVLSAIVAGVMIFYFFSFAFALGVRIFKLFLLQILSPIPIIAYIIPNKRTFVNKYLTMYINLYLEVFIRLFSVILVYNLAQTLIYTLNSDAMKDGGFMVTLVLIIALFQFAKSVPNMISDLLGIKVTGSEMSGVAAGLLGGAAGAVAGGVTGLVTGRMAGLGFGDSMAHMAMSTGRGAFGGYGGAKSGGFSGFAKSAAGTAGKGFTSANQVYSSGGYGNYLMGELTNKFGAEKYIERRREGLSDDITNLSQKREKIQGDIQTVDNLKNQAAEIYKQTHGGGVENSADYRLLQLNQAKAIEEMQKANSLSDNDQGKGLMLERARAQYDEAGKAMDSMRNDEKLKIAQYYDDVMAGNIKETDPGFERAQNLQELAKKIEVDLSDNKDVYDLGTYNSIDATREKLSQNYVDAGTAYEEAEARLKEFKDKKLYRVSTHDDAGHNKYIKIEEKRAQKRAQKQQNTNNNSSNGNNA